MSIGRVYRRPPRGLTSIRGWGKRRFVTLLFVVEDTFSIKGRGTVLVPGFPVRLKMTAGASLELRLPDGSRLATTIGGIAMCCPNLVPILVPVPKEQIPVGTEVWLSE